MRFSINKPARPLLAAAAALLLLALACGGGEGDDGRLKVVATTTQIGDFARNVGGERISLTVLLKPGQDAHDFAPSPSQVRRLQASDLILRNGVGLDTFAARAIERSSARVVIVSAGLDLRRADELDDEAGDAEAEAEAAGRDPHVWLSVANAARMVANIRDALAAADAANAAFYGASAARYAQQLRDLDASIRRQVSGVPEACRKLVTNHDVLGYNAEAYGLKLVGAVIPSISTAARASAADVAEIVRRIRAENVPAVFAETTVNPALIRQVAKEAKVAVVDDLYGDSLGAKGSDGATYVAMMESNTRKIVGALQGCRA